MFRKKPNESYLMLQLLRDIDIKLLLKRKCMGNGTIIFFFVFCTCQIITHNFFGAFQESFRNPWNYFFYRFITRQFCMSARRNKPEQTGDRREKKKKRHLVPSYE